MSYSSGMMDRRVTVVRRILSAGGDFGRNSGAPQYEVAGRLWAGVTFSKGVKAMREGALDAYDFIMVRTRWSDILTRECLIVADEKVYQIESFNADKHANTIQLTAREQVGKEGISALRVALVAAGKEKLFASK